MVACGTFTDEDPVETQLVFAQDGEFLRPLNELRVLPQTKLLSAYEIREATGYDLPARHILCRIHNAAAQSFIAEYFDIHGVVRTQK